ncbi:MAG: hypothetical protein D6759_00325, partial [Chloroflexi bacterium]
VNEWIDWYAVNVLIGNFEMIEKNYYLYHDLSTDRWTILPWDVDITFGLNVWGTGVGGALDSEISWDNPIDSGTWESAKYDGKWNALIDRMMAVPGFRAFYCRRLRELMDTLFSPDHLFPRIDAAFAYIRPWAEADPTPGWRNEGRPPQITGTAHTPAWPTAHDRVTVTTFVRDDGPALTVTLWYRAYVYGETPPDYQLVLMADDGAHGDGAANDGRFGAVIPFVPQQEGYWVEYFVEAEDAAGMVSRDRPGWPQGNYRYITGWQRLPLFINEVMALNTRTLEDEAGEHDDWVEVYNAGAVTVTLAGFYLTDDLTEPTKWGFPAGTVLPPGGYPLVWCDNDGGQGPLHAAFKLNRDGEAVGLFGDTAQGPVPLD